MNGGPAWRVLPPRETTMDARRSRAGPAPEGRTEADMARSEDEHRRLEGVRAVKLRFKISAYSPATMPMARLARYLDNLATVLGETKSVHLVGVEDGSTIPVLAVEYEAYRKVRQRASEVRNCEGSEHVLKARRAIEDDLAADDAEYAELVDEEGARILLFAGATGTYQPDYGPFSQPGTLDGVPIVIGGKDDPVPVHLQSHDRVHNCRASRELAKSIGVHLFTTPLRVSGVGRWLRDQDGAWTMLSFRIHEYAELRSESPADATRRLQSIDAAWKQRADPLGDLAALREFGG